MIAEIRDEIEDGKMNGSPIISSFLLSELGSDSDIQIRRQRFWGHSVSDDV